MGNGRPRSTTKKIGRSTRSVPFFSVISCRTRRERSSCQTGQLLAINISCLSVKVCANRERLLADAIPETSAVDRGILDSDVSPIQVDTNQISDSLRTALTVLTSLYR